MAKLRCQRCGHETDVPEHCGKEMSIQKVDSKEMLVCWMGPKCGKSDIPQHCGAPMAATG